MASYAQRLNRLNSSLVARYHGRWAELTPGKKRGCVVHFKNGNTQRFQSIATALHFYGLDSARQEPDCTYSSLPSPVPSIKFPENWRAAFEGRGYTDSRIYRVDPDGLCDCWRIAARDGNGHEVRGWFYPTAEYGTEDVAAMEMIRKPHDGWPIRLQDL